MYFMLGICSPSFIITYGSYDYGFSYSNRIKISFKILVFLMWQFNKLIQLSIRDEVHTRLLKESNFLINFLNAIECHLKNKDNII